MAVVVFYSTIIDYILVMLGATWSLLFSFFFFINL